MIMEFKKGDRVRLIQDVDHAKAGMIGTVMCKCLGKANTLAVDFDEAFEGGHACTGYTREDHGHWIYPSALKRISAPHKFTLVITSKGDHTEAKFLHGKKVIKTAEVNRFKGDAYSQSAAIYAIVNKMFPEDIVGITRDEPEEPPKFTGKAVCLIDGDWFTKGRVYDFDRGFVFEDSGHLCRSAPDDYDEWKEWFDARFIAIVDPEDKS